MLVGTGEYGSSLVDRELALTKQQRALEKEQEAAQTGASPPLIIGLSVTVGMLGLAVIILVAVILAKRKPAVISTPGL